MKYLLAIFCPFLVFFSIRKPFVGYFSILACLLVIVFSISIFYSYTILLTFWIFLVLWAFFEINEYNNTQNVNNIVHKVVTNQLNKNKDFQKYNNMQNLVTTAEFAANNNPNVNPKNIRQPLQITQSKDDTHLPVKINAKLQHGNPKGVSRKVLFNNSSRMFYKGAYQEPYEETNKGSYKKTRKIFPEEPRVTTNRFNSFSQERTTKRSVPQAYYSIKKKIPANKLTNYANLTEARLKKRMEVGEDILNNYSPNSKRNNPFRRY